MATKMKIKMKMNMKMNMKRRMKMKIRINMIEKCTRMKLNYEDDDDEDEEERDPKLTIKILQGVDAYEDEEQYDTDEYGDEVENM